MILTMEILNQLRCELELACEDHLNFQLESITGTGFKFVGIRLLRLTVIYHIATNWWT
jgi:hypothetical protein